jgi:drug/metabolite transporter (DMT)-like permease
VQPIIALQVVFALPLGIVVTSQRVSRREWAGAAVVVLGLAVFLAVSNPAAGRNDAPNGTWLLTSLTVAATASVLAIVGYRLPRAARPLCSVPRLASSSASKPP